MLPTPADEFSWFLEEIEDRLTTAQERIEAEREDARVAERGLEELCWLLAVLWRDPPTGDRGRVEVERWLKAKDLKSLVEVLYAQLAPIDPAKP